jgi:hypothetical protein
MPFRVFFEVPAFWQLYLCASCSRLSPDRCVALYICLAGKFNWGDCYPSTGVSLELPVSEIEWYRSNVLMRYCPDTCGECGRIIPELEPATRIMQQYPSQRQSHKLALVCTDCKPLHRIPTSTCRGCNRPLRLLSGFAGPYCNDRCFQQARHGGVLSNRTCEYCGESFTPKRSDVQYCSAKCRELGCRKKSA